MAVDGRAGSRAEKVIWCIHDVGEPPVAKEWTLATRTPSEDRPPTYFVRMIDEMSGRLYDVADYPLVHCITYRKSRSCSGEDVSVRLLGGSGLD
jgi:hypothetical protein